MQALRPHLPQVQPPRLRRAAAALTGLVLTALLAALAGWAGPAAALEPEAFERRVTALLEREGLLREGVSLLIQEPGAAAPRYALNPDAPRVPASNVKLVTSYVALRELTPNHRWQTRLHLVREHIDPALPPRQALLVQGGGDPTLTRADLQDIALRLRLSGLSRVDGALYYDDRLFTGPVYPESWGEVEDAMPWYAPVSPFILNLNTAGFLVVVDPAAPGVEVIPRQFLPEMRIATEFNWIEEGRETLSLRQVPTVDGLGFTVSGQLMPMERTFVVETAILDPVDHFFRQFRAALHEAGISGDMPLARFSGVRPSHEPVHTHLSRPLGAFLAEMNKDSNNLIAEVLLRSLALREQSPDPRVTATGLTGADGLAVVREVIAHDFPEFAEQVRIPDGSGLSRESQVSARFLVAMLGSVLGHFEFRAEYLNSLSVAGWDGTLQNRHLSRRHWGRIRAKSGTLKGVQNLSGYFSFGGRLELFSFLIQDDPRDYYALQNAQDRVINGIFDLIVAETLPHPSVKLGPPPKPERQLAAPPVPAPKTEPLTTASSE